MVRIVGGIILMRIGFSLFLPPSGSGNKPGWAAVTKDNIEDVAFVPLAMPLMFGPGVLATIIGMSSRGTSLDQILSPWQAYLWPSSRRC